MPKADRVTAALLLVFAVAFAGGALTFYRYWDDTGPGPAFLPLWLGVAMAALAVIMLFRRTVATPADWLPRGEGLRRMLVVMGLTVAFVALLKVTGMILGTALYLAILIRMLGQRWPVALVVGVAAAAFNWLVFAHFLRVPFPEGMLWIF